MASRDVLKTKWGDLNIEERWEAFLKAPADYMNDAEKAGLLTDLEGFVIFVFHKEKTGEIGFGRINGSIVLAKILSH